MRKDVYRLAGISAVLIIGLVVAAGYYLRGQRAERAEEVAKQARENAAVFVRPHSRGFGPPDAKVTVVEFLDPECESCRAMFPFVKKLLSHYGARVRLVIRYMPLHPNSSYAVSALEAAGEQGRFAEMLETLFVNQPRWADHHAPKPELIPEFARQVGLDMAAFNRSMNSGAHKSILESDVADGKKLGITATPTFFVNERLLEPLGFETLIQLIEDELAKGQPSPP